MVDEIYRLVAQFEPGSSEQRVAQYVQKISGEMQALARQQVQLGQADPASLQRLTSSVREAIRAGASGNDVLGRLPQQFREGLMGATGQAGQFLSQQARLFSSQIDLGMARAMQRAAANRSGTAYLTGGDLGATGPDAAQRYYQVRAFDRDAGPGERNEAHLRAERQLAQRLAAYNSAAEALEKSVRREAEAHDKAAAAAAKSARSAEEQDARERVAMQKRFDADQKADQARARASFAESQALLKMGVEEQAERAKAKRLADIDAQAARQSVSFPNAVAEGAVGRAQVGVNRAEIALATATERLAQERQRESRSVASLIQSQQTLRNAQAQLTQAQHRLSIASATPPTGLFAQFREGFKGGADTPYAQQIGQAFKFSVFYGTAYNLLFSLTQTFQATLQEGIEFQQAVSELKLASGRSAESANELANQLGATAANAGFAPSEGAVAGARAIGLYGATASDPATQNYIARLSTDIGSKLAFSSGMAMEDVQTRLAAITNAFQLGYAGQERVADLDAYFSKRFGVAPGATVRTVAEVGSVGQSAGFNLEEVNAIAALIMGRTGQTDSAVAGQLAQIFSRGGEGSLTAVAGRYGIDTSTATLAEQMQRLADVYQQASPTEQNEIAAAFGRGRVQNTISILLGSFDDVTQAANAAASGMADGAADKSFTERINNIGGELQLLLSEAKEFANLFGQSGILSLLGLGAAGLRELLEATNNFLTVWNQLPTGIRSVLASLALLAAASRLSAVQQAGGIGGLLAAGAGRMGGWVGRRDDGRLGVNSVPSRAGSVPLMSRAGMAAAGSMAASAAMSVGPWALAAGGLFAIGELAGAAQRLNEAMAGASDALNASTADLETADQWAASADSLRSQADGLGDQNWFERTFASPLADALSGRARAGQDPEALRADLQAEARRREAYAEALESRPVSQVAPALIAGFDSQSLSAGLDLLSQGGATAEDRFLALRDVLLGTAAAADAARTVFDADEFSGRAAPELRDWLSGGKDNYVFSNSEIEDALRRQVDEMGVESENLGADQRRELAARIVDDLYGFDPSQMKGEAAEWRSTLIDQAYIGLSETTRAVREVLRENRVLTDEEMTNVFNSFVADGQASLEALPESDLRGQLQVLRRTYRTLVRTARQQERRGGSVPAAAQQQIQDAREALLDGQIAQMEQMRIVAQQQALGDRGEVRRIGQESFIAQVNAAIAAGEAGTDVLVEKVQQASKWGRDTAIRLVQQQVDAIRQMHQALVANYANVAEDFIGPIPTMEGLENYEEYTGLQDLLKTLQNTPYGAGSRKEDPFLSGSDVPGYEAPEDPKASADERRQRMLSIRSSLRHLAIDLTDPVAEARVAVQDAMDQVKFAVTREERLAAKVDLRRAQIALQDEIRQRMLSIRASLRMLSIDLTNPLAEARVAVQDALDQVKHATSREERLAARVDLRRAQNDLEAQKFQQRLQSVQTAEELGRISHLKYVNYLERERDRLESIKKRTYQQQQQLDDVERLLKTAGESMQGQWNFGDIKLPTPYQVRRRVEQLYGDTMRGPTGDFRSRFNPGDFRQEQTVSIHINGADVAKVRQVIKEYIGGNVTTRTTRPRHR